MPRQLEGKSLEEIADFMAGVPMDSPYDQMAKAEFLFRQTKFQQQSADAAAQTATETQRYTRYMFWSVVVLAASSALTLLVAVATYFKEPPKQEGAAIEAQRAPPQGQD